MFVLEDVSDRVFHADDELYSRSTIGEREVEGCIMTDYSSADWSMPVYLPSQYCSLERESKKEEINETLLFLSFLMSMKFSSLNL